MSTAPTYDDLRAALINADARADQLAARLGKTDAELVETRIKARVEKERADRLEEQHKERSDRCNELWKQTLEMVENAKKPGSPEEIVALRRLASIARDAATQFSDWIGQASTRNAAVDSMYRLSRALTHAGFPYNGDASLNWRGSILDELNAAGFFFCEEKEAFVFDPDAEKGPPYRNHGNAVGPTLKEVVAELAQQKAARERFESDARGYKTESETVFARSRRSENARDTAFAALREIRNLADPTLLHSNREKSRLACVLEVADRALESTTAAASQSPDHDPHRKCASMIRRLMAYAPSPDEVSDPDKEAAIKVTLANARSLLPALNSTQEEACSGPDSGLALPSESPAMPPPSSSSAPSSSEGREPLVNMGDGEMPLVVEQAAWVARIRAEAVKTRDSEWAAALAESMGELASSVIINNASSAKLNELYQVGAAAIRAKGTP